MNPTGRSGPSAPRIKFRRPPPSIQALLIQVLALPLVLLCAHVVPLFADAVPTIAAAALLQGLLAAGFSLLFGLASWWLFIQLMFPIALIGALSLQLPPTFFLGGFILLLGVYWSIFRTQVPFYPSGPAVWDAVNRMFPALRPVRFIDIGSGLGGLVLHLSGRRPDSSFTGIELAPVPWIASLLRGRATASGARFLRGDYKGLDFANYDVVFAYLSPAAMPALWNKARAEMRAGSLLLSYEFHIPGADPHLVQAPVDGGPVLYGWYM
jgi:hypothetical protein